MRAGKGMGGGGGRREMGKHIAVKSGKKCLHLWMIQAIKSRRWELKVQETRKQGMWRRRLLYTIK